jgi:hypothetical protein
MAPHNEFVSHALYCFIYLFKRRLSDKTVGSELLLEGGVMFLPVFALKNKQVTQGNISNINAKIQIFFQPCILLY